MPRLSPLILSLFLFLAAPPVALGAGESEGDSVGELAREGVETLMRALEALIDEIPLYEMPELNEDGDIIIRRKRKTEEASPEDPDIDETSV
jgi:hypothetical protein